MEAFIPRNTKRGPEFIIQNKIVRVLRGDGWYVKVCLSNEYQSGFPDLFVCHTRYGSRWVEIKCPTGYNFTVAQKEDFLKLTSHGAGVWVLTSENETSKLHKMANWHEYLRWGGRGVGKERIASRNPTSGPEFILQQAIKAELEELGWYVKMTVGNIFQHGFPDLYATHPLYRARWIEIKNPNGYVFTPAQLETFPQFNANGVGVWVLNGLGQTDLLFKPHNWRNYL